MVIYMYIAASIVFFFWGGGWGDGVVVVFQKYKLSVNLVIRCYFYPLNNLGDQI